MRKLDKSIILSRVYKKWEEEFGLNKNHTKYDSSNNKFYYDVVMNLFYIQKGLCAYTERFLCSEKFYLPNNWTNGKYNFSTELKKIEFEGHLDHFDENLKSKNNEIEGRKDWLWTNFFMINEHTNTVIKTNKSVEKDDNGNYILKPDNLDYNEFELLEYNFDTNMYCANRKQPKHLRMKINKMINEVLGINHDLIVRGRSDILNKHKIYILAKEYDWQSVPFGEFPTVVEMYKNKYIKNINH